MLPVVLLHGSRTSATMWRRQVEALTRLDVPVVAVDLPGHGSRRDVRFGLDDAVDTVRVAVDDAGGSALVVGLSLGGYVAIEHRARHPEQSAGLVAASCCTDPATPLRAGWLHLARWIESWPDSGARLNELLVRGMLDAQSGVDLAAGGFALDAMADVLAAVGGIDVRAALGAATSPVRLVNGQWDHFRGHERSMLAAARSSGADARVVVVPHARHLVSLDQPVAFTRAVLEAYDAVGARA
ncbi:alpha/beta fold hydrolase [Isoptericola dokdonensis]|uniref:2-succinyl-6-hydroxy-2, 4-cyclohexadiene-1-carboxylate synthase n=1 Tax=Isoptericola dokdonensis DS-3 TaxID=1300344 RepID=A0A161IDE2_9MICO|nr:alpha/beta hydrolase [Isoptericola dokdonensis]ANC31161.1 2-succinyl-6-hydroxy-2,4-cyclohexadiene-1-carboxylate synthase [Isoptericola dokdonensis DS-3]